MKPFLLVSTRPEEEALASEYQAYLRSSGLESGELELAEFDLIGLPPVEPERYSGVFVAGSPYGGAADGYVSASQKMVREELTSLFQQLLDAGTPILATGSSMAILAEVLGLPTSAEYAEFGEVTEIEVTREGKEDPVFGDLPSRFPAYVNHAEAVEELPSPAAQSAVRLAWSLNTPIQAFRAGEHVYAVQFSPELDAGLMQAKMQAFQDAGDTGIGDTESLVTAGRYGDGGQAAGRVLSGFVRVFRQPGAVADEG